MVKTFDNVYYEHSDSCEIAYVEVQPNALFTQNSASSQPIPEEDDDDETKLAIYVKKDPCGAETENGSCKLTMTVRIVTYNTEVVLKSGTDAVSKCFFCVETFLRKRCDACPVETIMFPSDCLSINCYGSA